jgi:hypothetical protein
LFARLRARFHRGGDCGCDAGCTTGCATGCATGCCAGGGIAAPAVAPKPAGELIKPPKESAPGGEAGKKLPEGDKPEAKTEEKATEQGTRAPAILDVTPAAKAIETGTKSPY